MNNLSQSTNLTGFECLRCHSKYEIREFFEGCPKCHGEGHASSVAATYKDDCPLAGCFPLENVPSLGEGNTPLIELPQFAASSGVAYVAMKAEYLNPTGSHKDRMSQYAVAQAKLAGYEHVVAASSGNAGVSIAAYAAFLGLRCTILVKAATGGLWLKQMRRFGATIEMVKTSLDRWVRVGEMVRAGDAYPITNYQLPAVASNPYGVEGYRAVGHELFAQANGDIDCVIVPTARGDLLWGTWKGLKEAHLAAGRPFKTQMVAVEPFARLSRVLKGEDYRGSFKGSSLQSSTTGDTATWQSVSALRASKGLALDISDDLAIEAQSQLNDRGMALELCSASCLPALQSLCDSKVLGPSSRVVCLGTADGRYESPRT